jgi:hypothetical protein
MYDESGEEQGRDVERESPEGKLNIFWRPSEQRDDGEWYGCLSIVFRAAYERPDYWCISWWQYRDYLLNELPNYLLQYYPGDLGELMGALRELDLGF